MRWAKANRNGFAVILPRSSFKLSLHLPQLAPLILVGASVLSTLLKSGDTAARLLTLPWQKFDVIKLAAVRYSRITRGSVLMTSGPR